MTGDVEEHEKHVIIYGIRYDKNLFKVFAMGAIGQSFRIIRRDDGMITFQKLTPGTTVPGMEFVA